MPFIGIFAWNQFKSAIPQSQLDTATQANTPGSPGYNSSAYTWIGETVTFTGGAPVQIDIDDDDSIFEDAYVETGGSQTLVSDVVVGGVTYPAGSVVQNEFSLIDENGNEYYVVRIGSVNVGLAVSSSSGLTEPPASFEITDSLDGDPADNADGTSSSSTPYLDVICFAAGTRIATPDGLRQVQHLQVGDAVNTAHGPPQPLIWTHHSTYRFPETAPSALPVHFAPGSLGHGTPWRPLVVSPQHRMLLHGHDIAHICGQDTVLAPAKGLLPLRGVRRMWGKRAVTYVHLLLPRHDILLVEGCPSESFYPGPNARRALLPAVQSTLDAALLSLDRRDYGPLCQPSLRVQAAKKLAAKLRTAWDVQDSSDYARVA